MASDVPEAPNIFDPGVAACPQAAYRTMLDECPVSLMPLTGGPIISRYEDVMFALRHPKIFSSAMEAQMGLGTDRPMIPQQIDPPAQTKYRKLLDPRFSASRMLELEPSIRASARKMIEVFADRGECDYSKEFAIPFPCEAFLHLFGLPLEDLSLFLEMKDGIIRPQTVAEDPTDLEAVANVRAASGKRIYAYFEDLIEKRRRDPRDDLMSFLLEAEIDGEKLSQNEVLDISFLQLLAGLDTVTATLGCSFAYLATNPEQQLRLREDASRIKGAIEELLRWETPVVGVPRLIKQDIEIGGASLEAGQMVILLLGAANIDPREFDAAEVVDFERERNRQIAFGGGNHRCLGSHLARMELRVAFEEWHRRIPAYHIKQGETPIYTGGIREVQNLPLVWGRE